MMYAIETSKLTKKFGSLRAVDAVSIKVKPGEIFGLLGPNGAGKTTLISMLVTMKKPTSGHASVNGFDVVKNPDGVRKSIGIVFQDPSLDEELTAFENLELHAAMYGIPKKERGVRINEVIETVELKDRLNDIVKTFSGGMRRRLELARGLLHCPKILFLDEPTLGLDPQTRKHIWEYIRKLREEHGVTVVMTTHYLDEADSLCDRIAIIDNGKKIVLESGQALKDSLGGDVIIIETAEGKRLITAVRKLPWIKSIKEHDGKINLKVRHGDRKIPKLLWIAKRNGVTIQSVDLHKPTLDDVFLHYTGKTIHNEAAPSFMESVRIRSMSRRGSM